MKKIHVSNRIRPEAYRALERGIERYGSQTEALENLLLLGAAAMNGGSLSDAHSLPTNAPCAHCKEDMKLLSSRLEVLEKRLLPSHNSLSEKKEAHHEKGKF